MPSPCYGYKQYKPSQLNIIHLITPLSTSLPWNCFYGFITFCFPLCGCAFFVNISSQRNTTFPNTSQIQILPHIIAFTCVDAWWHAIRFLDSNFLSDKKYLLQISKRFFPIVSQPLEEPPLYEMYVKLFLLARSVCSQAFPLLIVIYSDNILNGK